MTKQLLVPITKTYMLHMYRHNIKINLKYSKRLKESNQLYWKSYICPTVPFPRPGHSWGVQEFISYGYKPIKQWASWH